MRLTHRIVGLVGGRRGPASSPAGEAASAGATMEPVGTDVLDAVTDPQGQAAADPPGQGTADPAGPGAATAAALAADPCGPARAAVEDACSLADRMSALALASQERLREARRAYDEHAGRRERAAASADPRAIRAAKDEAQSAFRRARLAARDRAALEAAAGEWLREIDRVNARTRDATRVLGREDAAETRLLQALDRLGVEADGARIAAESAAEACRNARITLATCEERERIGVGWAASDEAGETLAPASVVARATIVAPFVAQAESRASAAAEQAREPAAVPTVGGRPGVAEPSILPLLSGDPDVRRRLAAAIAGGDRVAEQQWEAHLSAFVEAVRARAIDSAALTFPEGHPFWGPHTQLQCREISAALAALGYRFDGSGGFVDGRVPGQRELSLAIGYAGLDPMRVRIWPTEAELPLLYADVEVDAGRFVAEAAGELTLGEMIDMLGRRAEELSDLWNAWGRVRPLLLQPA